MQVLFYLQSPAGLVNRRNYLGGVQAICLNATHVAVLTGGRVLMHPIEQQQMQGTAAGGIEVELSLPKPGAVQAEPITRMALSQHFLVTATASGTLCYHMLQDGELAAVNEHKHTGRLF